MSQKIRKMKIKNVRVILLGRTGEGKSALGNLILGKKDFVVSSNPASSTQESKSASRIRDKYNLTVVDTPGLFCTDKSLIEVAINVQMSFEIAKPGPHAFLIVIKIGRYTEEMNATIQIIKIMFGPEALKHSILVFTDANALENSEESPEGFINEFSSNENTKPLFDGCGGRFAILDNFEKDQERKERNIKYLVQKIIDVSKNGKEIYNQDVGLCKEVLLQYVEKFVETNLTAEQFKKILDEQEKKRMTKFIKTLEIVGAEGLISGAASSGLAALVAKVGFGVATTALGTPVAVGACIGAAVGACVGTIVHKRT